MHGGFTLIQVSILLVVASLVLVAILPSTRTSLTANQSTVARMNTLLGAIRTYQASNGKLPCPADASQPIGSSTYGIMAANAGTTNNCAGGTPAANYTDSANNIAIGMVPVRTLGLSSDYALDSYGRDITYAVDTDATSCWTSTSLTGKIIVTDNGTATNSLFALVSHGPDGHGAWLPLTGTTGTAVRLNAGSTDANQLTNAHVNSSFTATTPLTNFVRTAPTSTFDDLVVYSSNLWNMNTLPANYQLLAPTVTGPVNGNYVVGEKLLFTATYNSATINVSGTPRLDLTVGASTRYATYTSSSVSGSMTTLTFTYTVQASDVTTTGIVVSSPIDLNGGNITNGSACILATFTPPSLPSVLVSAPSGAAADVLTNCTSGPCLYFSDTNNSRFTKWSTAPAYATQAGTSGTGSANLSNPSFIAYANGSFVNKYIFMADTGNNRIVGWNNTNLAPTVASPYTFGSSGSTAGLFNAPTGMAYDNSISCVTGGGWPCLWIADTGNNQLQLCSAAMNGNCSLLNGTYSGSKLSIPTGITDDATSAACTSSHCIYVVDTGNNRILKFLYTTTYVSAFGSAGGAGNAGKFNNPTGIAVDNSGLCTGSSGSGLNCMWIADSANNQIQRCPVDMSGGSYCTIYSTLSGATPATFNNPTGITVSGSNVFVVDQSNDRVVVLTTAGAYVTSFGTYGTGNSNFNF